MPTSIYDYSKNQLTAQYMGATERQSHHNAEDLEMGVSGAVDNPCFSINNQSHDFSENDDGEEMDIESQRPYPTSTFFSNNELPSSQPVFTSTGSGVAP